MSIDKLTNILQNPLRYNKLALTNNTFTASGAQFTTYSVYGNCDVNCDVIVYRVLRCDGSLLADLVQYFLRKRIVWCSLTIYYRL